MLTYPKCRANPFSVGEKANAAQLEVRAASGTQRLFKFYVLGRNKFVAINKTAKSGQFPSIFKRNKSFQINEV